MIIRKATYADAAELANVHTNSWREAYKDLLPSELLDDRPLQFKNRYQLWQRVTQESSALTFVADSGDTHGVVGFIHGAGARDEAYKDYAEVWSFYLLEKYHRQGVGFRLLQALFQQFLEEGFEKAYLWVLDENPTIRFYERTGGHRSADAKTEFIGGKEVVEVRYVWDRINAILRI